MEREARRESLTASKWVMLVPQGLAPPGGAVRFLFKLPRKRQPHT